MLPDEIKRTDQITYRSISVEGDEIEFSGGFTDLHTLSYLEILKGNGFGLADARSSINTVYDIRNATPVGIKNDYHPLCRNIK